MPGPLTKSIAAILNAAVKQRGLTQLEVANELGQSQSQVSKYLRGEVVMDAEEIDTICRVVGLNIADVIKRADKERHS